MDMYFSAKTQTLAQFKAVYDKRFLNETPQNGSRHILRYGKSNAPKQV